MNHIFKTSLHLTFSGLANEAVVPVTFEYTVNWGSEATREQPAEGPTVGVRSITLTDSAGGRHDAPAWLWTIVEGDQELGDELVAEARSDDEAAAEHAAAMKSEFHA